MKIEFRSFGDKAEGIQCLQKSAKSETKDIHEYTEEQLASMKYISEIVESRQHIIGEGKHSEVHSDDLNIMEGRCIKVIVNTPLDGNSVDEEVSLQINASLSEVRVPLVTASGTAYLDNGKKAEFIFMTKVEGFNLLELKNLGCVISDRVKQQLIEEVEKLHAGGIAHGDLSEMKNIMIECDREEILKKSQSGEKVVVDGDVYLIDFGHARYINYNPEHLNINNKNRIENDPARRQGLIDEDLNNVRFHIKNLSFTEEEKLAIEANSEKHHWQGLKNRIADFVEKSDFLE